MTTEDWLVAAGLGCLVVAALWMLGNFLISLLTARNELITSAAHDRRVMQQKIQDCIQRDLEGDPEALSELRSLLTLYRS